MQNKFLNICPSCSICQSILLFYCQVILSYGETVKTVTDFIFFFGSKITADGDCSHEIKRCLLLERKVMISLDSILKSRDTTLPTKVRLAMVFPVVMYGCESWTTEKAEHRIDAFDCGAGEDS